jgi:hypothetical protein
MEDLRKTKVMYWDGKKAGSAKGMGSEPWEGGVWSGNFTSKDGQAKAGCTVSGSLRSTLFRSLGTSQVHVC